VMNGTEIVPVKKEEAELECLSVFQGEHGKCSVWPGYESLQAH